MFKVGERIKYRRALDADYSYGTIRELEKGTALVECEDYYYGFLTAVPIRYLEKLDKGGLKGGSNRKKYSKRPTTKTKLQRQKKHKKSPEKLGRAGKS